MVSKNKTKRTGKLLVALLIIAMTVCALFTTAISASAESNEAANAAAQSLVEVRVAYVTKEGKKQYIQRGTGFMINQSNVVTCDHVARIDDSTESALKEKYGSQYDKNNIAVEIIVTGDVPIPATIKKYSETADFAIITLNEPIYSRTPATLGVGDDVTPTQTVYALGFPGAIANVQDKNTYTPEDATITKGDVSKKLTSGTVDFIQHNATLTSGNSGGPLVDENGYVIGINADSSVVVNYLSEEVVDVNVGDYSYSINIDQVVEVLKALGIDYTAASGSVSTLTSSAASSSEASSAEESSEPESEPVEEITSTGVTESEWEPESVATETEESGSKIGIIIAAIAVVLVLVIVIIVVILLSVKKNDSAKIQPATTMPMPGAMPGAAPQQPPFAAPNPVAPPMPSLQKQPVTMGAAPTMISNEGAGETSVLNQGAGETTVLGMGAASTSFSLVRKSTGEKISINKPEFVVGKERRRVDYCIMNNNSISRTHAKLKIRGDKCYITDLGSTNCTFVNGTKISPNQEVALNKGDEIRFAEESFEFLG